MKLKTFEQYLDALRSYFSLLVIFVLLSRSLQVSCCLQVQVIKHRPKQMQKAYPGLLEPGYSYNITSFASNRTQTIKPSKGRRPLCTFLLSAHSSATNSTAASTLCAETLASLSSYLYCSKDSKNKSKTTKQFELKSL